MRAAGRSSRPEASRSEGGRQRSPDTVKEWGEASKQVQRVRLLARLHGGCLGDVV